MFMTFRHRWIFGLFMVLSWMACTGRQPPISPDGDLVILPRSEQVYTFPDASSLADERALSEKEHTKDSNQQNPPDIPDSFEQNRTVETEQTHDFGHFARESIIEQFPDTKPTRSSWIGGACVQNANCAYAGGLCLTTQRGFPGGLCSKRCTSTCPDRTGEPTTFCVDDGTGQGICVQQCEQTGCRKGYQCETRMRLNQAAKTKRVCIPNRTTPSGSQVSILHIGDSQSSGTPFSKVMVDYLRNPKLHCPSAKTGGNKVFSYAKVSAAARHWSELSGGSKNWLCAAAKVYTNGTASSNTTGSKLCAGISSLSKSVFQKLVGRHKPNVFLVQLGGNSAGFGQNYVKSRVRRMLDQMPSGSLCYWVSPSHASPHFMPKRRDVVQWIRETLGLYTRIKCKLIESIDAMAKQTTCTKFNVGDGLHMTSCGSRVWGEFVRGVMCRLGGL